MKWPFTSLRILVIGVFISLTKGQSPFVMDSTLSSIIPQSISNSIQIADINNDGYNDIIYSGYDPTRSGLFIDVIRGNQTLFMRKDEVEASWLWIDSISKSWEINNTPNKFYEAGSDGSGESILINNHSWH